MRVLIACEFSGVIREAFRATGHDAWSCDLLPAMDASPCHIQRDVIPLIGRAWDLIISHPPCTYLSSSGARWFNQRRVEQVKAAIFFMRFTSSPAMWAIENPIGIMSSCYRKPDQIVQPWMFGHGETKATCLWLNRLPKLVASDVVSGRIPRVHFESPGMRDGLTRQQRRSITYQGMADAMASQWGAA